MATGVKNGSWCRRPCLAQEEAARPRVRMNLATHLSSLPHRVKRSPSQNDRQLVNVETCGSELLASALDDFIRRWFDIL